jgi:hypothetical protein
MSVLIKFRLLLNFDHARRRKSGFIRRSDNSGGAGNCGRGPVKHKNRRKRGVRKQGFRADRE